MVVLVLAAVAGALAALGPLHWLAGPAAHATGGLSHMVGSALPAAGPPGTGRNTLVLLIQFLVPAFVAAGLLIAARAAVLVRRALAVIAVVLGISGFFFLPAIDAWSLAAFCVVCAIAGFFTISLLDALLAFGGAYLATSLIRSIWVTRTGTHTSATAQALAHQLHLSPGASQALLSVLVVLICAAGAAVALRPRHLAAASSRSSAPTPA